MQVRRVESFLISGIMLLNPIAFTGSFKTSVSASRYDSRRSPARTGYRWREIIGFIRSRVLSEYLGTVDGRLSAPPIEGTHLRVLKSLSEASQPPTISELERQTGIARRDLKKVLTVMRPRSNTE
jgi:hypothetical protein